MLPFSIPEGANPVAAVVAMLLGSLFGMRYDPVTWALIALCVGAAAFGLRAYVPLLLALLGTAVTVAVAHWWWTKLGLSDRWVGMTAWRFVLNAIVAYAGYGIGLLVRQLFVKQHA